MLKLHARGCSEERKAAALALVGACFALTPETSHSTNQDMSDIDLLMASAGKAALLQEDMYLEKELGSLNIKSNYAFSQNPLDAAKEESITQISGSHARCFTSPDQPDVLTTAQSTANRNSLFLAVSYKDEFGDTSWGFGTGTLIQADNGENRVLTADHVALHSNTLPEKIFAFHSIGYLLAEIEPTVFVHQDVDKSVLGEYRNYDLAVLTPVKFYSEDAEFYWNKGGAKIADLQSDTLMQAFAEDANIAIAHGSSGGAIFNQDGDVFGVMTELYKNKSIEDWRLLDTEFLTNAAISAHQISGDFDLTMTLLDLDDESVGSPIQRGILGVVPVTHPDILEGLGVAPGGVQRSPDPTDGNFYSASYTSGHCVESSMHLVDTGVAHKSTYEFEKRNPEENMDISFD